MKLTRRRLRGALGLEDDDAPDCGADADALLSTAASGGTECPARLKYERRTSHAWRLFWRSGASETGRIRRASGTSEVWANRRPELQTTLGRGRPTPRNMQDDVGDRLYVLPAQQAQVTNTESYKHGGDRARMRRSRS